jgi:hypothetical protein
MKTKPRTVHWSWGRRSRCGRGSSRTSNLRRVTCRSCLRYAPKELFP